MILPPLLSDGEAEIPLLSAVLLPLLCGFGARGSEYQIRGSECDVRHVRAPRILWFAQRNLWIALPILWLAPMNAGFAMGILSKTHQSSLTLKGGSTSFPKPLFSWRRLAALGKVQASLTLLSFAQPFPSGDRGCANRPTRCSNRFAIRLADHQRSRQQQSCILRYATAWTRIA